MEASLRPVTFLFLVFLIIIHPNFFCNGDSQSQIRCIQSERNALLKFKQHLQDPSNRLASWAGDGDCCQWMGVVCHNVTGHVHQLHLRSIPPIWDRFTADYDHEAQYKAQYEAYLRSKFGGKLNPALLDLKYLNYLDVSYNNFNYTQIPKFLGSMESLRYLNLSRARFEGVIPHQLGNLSNLQYLNLEGYGLYVNNLQWLSGLPLLQHLDMSSVNLSEASDWLQVTNKLPSLLELQLSGCEFPFIPPTPSVNFSSLTTLDLSENRFENTSIPSWIVGLRNLVFLDLSQNFFQGPIPVLQNMTSLRHLDLKGSDLYVNNLQWLSGLPLLQHLDMSSVNLSEASDWLQVTNKLPSLLELRLSYCELRFIPPTPSVNFSSLTTLDLSENRFENTLILSWIVGLRNLVFLDLSYNFFQGPIPVLQNMTSLRHLDLSVNNFNHSIPNWFYSFSHLEFLSLRSNNLQGTISSAITNLTSAISMDFSSNEFSGYLRAELGQFKNLHHLSFSENAISGPIPESLGNLSSLTYLDLSDNQFNGTFPQNFRQLKNLVTLSFQKNTISGPIPVSLGNLSSLTYLELSHNQFKTFPQNFGQFKNLYYLSFWNNSISGPIPESLGNLSSLTYLDLSDNRFNGTLPQNFGQLSNLETLYIESNMLEGVVSEVHFSNLSRLRELYAFGNRVTLEVSHEWIPPFQLEDLNLGSWNLGPKFPPWLCSQKLLQNLDISNTRVSDVVPPLFWNLTSQLSFLNLSHNLIYGEIPNNAIFSTASMIDLSSNHFNGSLPCISSNVFMLDLSNNSLSGSISHFLCYKMNELKQMKILNLGKNLLSGKIPDCWMKWHNLEALNLGNNNFTGSIPASIGSLTLIKSLHLHNNKLSGKLPLSLKNCEKLVTIDVAENEFVGNIPSWIGHRCSSLMILSLRSNNFHGHIPEELCALTSLQILDLSHNILSGSIPRCVKNFSAMATKNNSDHIINFNFSTSIYGESLPLESALLVIKGRILEYSTILQLVKSIDFSKNRLSGEIPEEVTSLQGLQSLNFSYNLLIGSIPKNMGAMRSLESIDFSLNQLSGQIPSSMSSLTFLNHLNLSNNNLTGKIPFSTQLQSLDASGFVGNKLCGPPLADNCTVNGVIPNNENIGCKDTGGLEVDWFYVSMALGFVVGFWGVCGPLLLNKQWRIMYFQFLDHMGCKLKGVLSL